MPPVLHRNDPLGPIPAMNYGSTHARKRKNLKDKGKRNRGDDHNQARKTKLEKRKLGQKSTNSRSSSIQEPTDIPPIPILLTETSRGDNVSLILSSFFYFYASGTPDRPLAPPPPPSVFNATVQSLPRTPRRPSRKCVYLKI